MKNFTALGLGLAFSVAAVAAPAAALPPVSQVYVFGDSFVDSGNANIGTGGLTAPAEQGYFKGRYGDGYNFADIISNRLTGDYATPFLAGGTNYAVGGARATDEYFIPPFPQAVPGLPQQLEFYGSQFGTNVDPDGVYLIVFGNNDVNAIQAGDTYGLTATQYGNLYVSNIVNTILGLNAGGAGQIILFGVPNPGEAEGQMLADQLATGIAAIRPFLTSPFVQFDFFDFFARVQAAPQDYGLAPNTDFTTPCLAVQPVVNGKVDCTGYLSFDGTHVTKPVQRAIAIEALALSGLAVPEPTTWALLIAGFGLTGAAMRRRRASMPVA